MDIQVEDVVCLGKGGNQVETVGYKEVYGRKAIVGCVGYVL